MLLNSVVLYSQIYFKESTNCQKRLLRTSKQKKLVFKKLIIKYRQFFHLKFQITSYYWVFVQISLQEIIYNFYITVKCIVLFKASAYIFQLKFGELN